MLGSEKSEKSLHYLFSVCMTRRLGRESAPFHKEGGHERWPCLRTEAHAGDLKEELKELNCALAPTPGRYAVFCLPG